MLERMLDDKPGLDTTTAARPQARESAPGKPGQSQEEIWLLGQPPLSRYLDFVEGTVVDGENADRAALIEEWCRANDYYQELERTEAGIANEAGYRELDPALAALAIQVKAHPRFRRAFDTLPTELAMVELDRLIVYQKHVTRDFVDGLMTRLGPAPDPVRLFQFCIPLGVPDTPVEIRRVGSHRYVFRCESTDFRYHEPTLLRHEQVSGYESSGPISGIVGLVVGFGSNFLNVVRVGKRMMLNNGYHRACALRALGVTHVPCIVQTAKRADEVDISVRSDVAQRSEFYFESARPPLLKDFFDPKIRKLLPIRRRTRQIEVSFEVKDYLVSE